MPFLEQWQGGQHAAEVVDAIAYGNGRFVMVAGDMRAWWSPDGSRWLPVSTATCLHAITFGGGLFVAVGDYLVDTPLGERWQMAVTISPDGESWASQIIADSALPELGLSGIGYGTGMFVAVGPRGRLYTSSDPGGFWQRRLSTTNADLRGVAYGDGVFVVVGEWGTILVSQDQGVTWQTAAIPTQQKLWDVAYGKGVFIAVGQGGTILRSPDQGQSWEINILAVTGDLRSIAYGHEAFAVAGEQVLTSADGGRSWQPIGLGGEGVLVGSFRSEVGGDPPVNESLNGITFGQHRFVAVGPHGRLFQSERASAQLRLALGSKPERGSPGAETELLLTVANSGPDLAPDLYADLVLQGDLGIARVLPSQGGYAMVNSTTLRYGVGILRPGEQAAMRIVLLPQSRGVIELSTDAWADVHLPDPATHRTRKIIPVEAPPPRPSERWLPRVFIAEPRALRAAAFGNGIWVAVGDGGLIMGSWDDGESWDITDAETDRSLTAVAHGPEGFVVVGEDGVTLWSRDARRWQSRGVKPAVNFRGVACSGDCSVAVGDGGAILTSLVGGGDWQRVLSPTNRVLRAITHSGYHFTAVGDGGIVLESPDGWAWSQVGCPGDFDLRCVAHGQRQMVIAAADGSVLVQGGRGWEKIRCGGAKELHGVCFGGGEYLAAGGIFTSRSGSDWQECNVGQIGEFYGSAFGNGKFVVVGPQGMIMQSLPVVPESDLTLALQCSPEVRRGQLLRAQLLVANRGSTPAARVTLTVQMPPRAAFAWANTINGQCRQIGASVICELGDLHPGAESLVVIAIKPQALEPIHLQAVVSGSGYDPDLRNNRVHCTSRVVAEGPQLTLKQRAAPGKGSLLIVLQVANNGPGTAYEVTMTDPLPQGTVFNSASTSQGLFIVPKHGQHGGVVCQIGTIEEGERVHVHLQLGLTDGYEQRLTNTANLEATNAKSVSSTVVVWNK